MKVISLCRTVGFASVLAALVSCGAPAGGTGVTDAGNFNFLPSDGGNGNDNDGHDAGSNNSQDAGSSGSTKTCADELGSGWNTSLTASDFSSNTDYQAYAALNKCACVDTSTGSTPSGCADICSEPQDGTMTPNFCNGVGALTQCYTCIMASCSAAYAACMGH